MSNLNRPDERGLPSNVYAERMVLGSCFALEDNGARMDVLLKLEQDDFSVEKHRRIFSSMRSLAQSGFPIDHVTVANWFMSRGELDAVDGLTYLVYLEEGLPGLLNIGSYIDILKKLSRLRRIIFTANEAMNMAFMQAASPDNIATTLAQEMRTLVGETEKNGPQSIAEFVNTYKGGIDALMTPHITQPGIHFGFPRFDDLTDGAHEDEIFVFGAPPSGGKTALGLQIARNIAEQGKPVAVFSMEMSKRSLFYRLICDEAQVPFQRFRKGDYNQSEADRLKAAAAVIYELPIHVDERSGMCPAEFNMRLKALAEKHGVVISILDFIQIMQSDNKRLTGAEKMNNICNGIQSVVKETHIPTIILSQLNRDSSKGKRQPEMYDYKESSAIEQIADVGGLIWREELFARDKPALKGMAKMLVRKARNAPLKEIAMRYIGWRMRFEELTEAEESALG